MKIKCVIATSYECMCVYIYDSDIIWVHVRLYIYIYNSDVIWLHVCAFIYIDIYIDIYIIHNILWDHDNDLMATWGIVLTYDGHVIWVHVRLYNDIYIYSFLRYLPFLTLPVIILAKWTQWWWYVFFHIAYMWLYAYKYIHIQTQHTLGPW